MIDQPGTPHFQPIPVIRLTTLNTHLRAEIPLKPPGSVIAYSGKHHWVSRLPFPDYAVLRTSVRGAWYGLLQTRENNAVFFIWSGKQFSQRAKLSKSSNRVAAYLSHSSSLYVPSTIPISLDFTRGRVWDRTSRSEKKKKKPTRKGKGNKKNMATDPTLFTPIRSTV
jgi:hypothetical protein